jgi:hypothetical protein
MVLITRALIDQRKEHASPEAECPSLCGQFSVADCFVQTRDLDYLLGAVQVLRNFPDKERQKGGRGVNHVICCLMQVYLVAPYKLHSLDLRNVILMLGGQEIIHLIA